MVINMGNIHILASEVSNKIAAGEVVERPLSIVKELVENSIDAGADVITVEIRDGGISYIKVTDNGSGMSEEDAKICFLRHATSKIATGEDLDAIYTLGFRGEALSSIGAVTKVRLFTKKHDADMGVLVTCEGGEILSSAESGMSDGTVIEVCDLFYNTPARKKFLKKPAIEGGYISDLMGRYVFAYPEISFKLIRDGKEIIFSSGDNNIINAVYSVYGKDYAKNMLSVDYEYNGIRITGLIGKGTLCRPNRSYETFFVNKRYIKSAIMIRALEEAYKNQIMISKFPTAIINVEIPAELVDINVHPTKLECKFSNEQDIYQAVFHGVKSALYELPNVPEIDHSPKEREEIPNTHSEQQSIEDLFLQKLRESKMKNEMQQRTIVEPTKPVEAVAEQRSEVAFVPEPKTEVIEKTEVQKKKMVDVDEFAMIDFALEQANRRKNSYRVESASNKADKNTDEKEETWRDYFDRRMKEEEEKLEINNPFRDGYFRVIGQVFDTYILVEKDDNLLMIDQHAAHERLNYEALKAELAENGIVPQMILEPIEIKLHPNECVVYEENKADFKELGFESCLDGDTVSITALPGDIGWSEGEQLFVELLTQMDEMKNTIISEKKERLLYTISCKAAIKANMRISNIEMEKLVEKVFKLENINTCPHGRPIVISMTKKQIEKDFKRIV